jgi:hypothetical protein
MKHLVLTLWFVLFLSSSALAGVEYVTEEVCHAMSGCWMDTKTGECPDCVIERREVVHTHEVEKPVRVEKSVIVEKPIVRVKPNRVIPKKVKKVKWTCIIKPCDFIDENGNLIEKS